MTAKHTPGPWNTGNSINEFKEGSAWTVPVWSHNGPEWGKMAAEAIAPTREMAQANARLISAAPDLLEACKIALNAFEHNYAIDWAVLQSAISKAEGL
jgi:hypothetical protein